MSQPRPRDLRITVSDQQITWAYNRIARLLADGAIEAAFALADEWHLGFVLGLER